MKDRGLSGVKLIASDKCSGLHGIIGDFFPNAKWQRCVVHWDRNAFTMSPWKHVKSIAAMLKAIHAQEDREVNFLMSIGHVYVRTMLWNGS